MIKYCPYCTDGDGEAVELSYDEIKPHWENYHCFECGYDVQGSEILGYEVTKFGSKKRDEQALQTFINQQLALYEEEISTE